MFLEKNPATRQIYRSLLALDDKIQGIPFPQMKRIKQITSSHCGPAVLADLFSFFGLRLGQARMVRSIHAKKRIKNFGLLVSELAKIVKTNGGGKYVFWKKEDSKVSDLDAIINKYKSPVAVEWQGIFYEFADEDNGHYGVVTKIDKKSGYLRIADPYSEFAGIDRRLKIDDFVKRWWDDNEIKVKGTRRKKIVIDHRLMFLITPKGVFWPKKLGMTQFR